MRELERFATIAGRVLADVATGQPVQDPRREGAQMPEPDEYIVTEYDLRSAQAVVNLDRPEDDPAPAEEATR